MNNTTMEHDSKKKIEKSFQNKPLPSADDEKFTEEKDALELSKEQQVKITGELHDARISYSSKIFWIALSWLAFTATILVLTGIGCLRTFESSVLIALISSTTVATLGLFFAISKLLSPKQSDDKEQSGIAAKVGFPTPE